MTELSKRNGRKWKFMLQKIDMKKKKKHVLDFCQRRSIVFYVGWVAYEFKINESILKRKGMNWISLKNS